MLNERRLKSNIFSATEGKTVKTLSPNYPSGCFVHPYEPPCRPQLECSQMAALSSTGWMPAYTRLHRIPEGPLKLEPYFVGETISINVSALTFQSSK